jgi:catechol 2,3-dioxygenase-like lactoylglutathione lyase family enzyme
MPKVSPAPPSPGSKKTTPDPVSEPAAGPPTGGWAALAPELLVTDFAASMAFWCGILGFAIAYQRPEQSFAYLEREAAQVMLCQRDGQWETAPLERPFGRGVMLQLYFSDIAPTLAAVRAAGVPVVAGPREVWRRAGACEAGQREFFVQDPDGYLLMVAQNIGERPLSLP